MSLTLREFGEAKGNRIKIEEESVSVGEDVEETRQSKSDAMLQDIDDLGCRRFSPRDIAIVSRKSGSRYLVQVGSMRFMEQKMPFTAG